MTVTLTSVEHAVSYLSDRTLVSNVADDMRKHLDTATRIICQHIGMTLTTGTETHTLDIDPSFCDTPGVLATPFTTPYNPRFPLATPSSLTGLVVKYRGNHELSADFTWDDVEPLVLLEDYLYDQSSNEVRLLFEPTAMVHGLNISYNTGFTSTPEKLYGSDRRETLHGLGVDTALSPFPALVTGVPHKLLDAAATAPGAQPNLTTIEILPQQSMPVHEVLVHSPQNAALVDVQQAVTLTLQAGPDGSEIALDTLTLETPLQGQSYRLTAAPDTSYDRYLLSMTGTLDANVAVGLMDVVFADTTRSHLRNSVPDDISTACALFAVHLHKVTSRDGVAKTSDSSNRPYKSTGALMPPEVSALLRSYKRSRVTFV